MSARLKADPASINEVVHKKAVQLQTTLQHHILPQTETKLRESARTIAQFIHTKVRAYVLYAQLHTYVHTYIRTTMYVHTYIHTLSTYIRTYIQCIQLRTYIHVGGIFEG